MCHDPCRVQGTEVSQAPAPPGEISDGTRPPTLPTTLMLPVPHPCLWLRPPTHLSVCPRGLFPYSTSPGLRLGEPHRTKPADREPFLPGPSHVVSSTGTASLGGGGGGESQLGWTEGIEEKRRKTKTDKMGKGKHSFQSFLWLLKNMYPPQINHLQQLYPQASFPHQQLSSIKGRLWIEIW